LVLVRHGRAAAGWGEDLDPGLDDVGRAQAQTAANVLVPLGPLPVVVSPLRRARETAAPLEERWGVIATVDPSVGEIDSPSPDLGQREAWLRELMRGTWSDAPALAPWRLGVIAALAGIGTDAVVVSHFVAINAAIGSSGAPASGSTSATTPSTASCTRQSCGAYVRSQRNSVSSATRPAARARAASSSTASLEVRNASLTFGE